MSTNLKNQDAHTWKCRREVENTLVKLTDGVPVIEEHLYHLPPTHWLRQRVFICQIHVPCGG